MKMYRKEFFKISYVAKNSRRVARGDFTPRPGRPGSCLPGPPLPRTCPIRASGSSVTRAHHLWHMIIATPQAQHVAWYTLGLGSGILRRSRSNSSHDIGRLLPLRLSQYRHAFCT